MNNMIYEILDEYDPIRQGDIFFGLPFVEISLKEMQLIRKDDELEKGEETEIVEWRELASSGEIVPVVCPVKSTKAIVITQDCDAVHSKDITLCEIREFKDVYPNSTDAKTAKSRVKIITQHARMNLKWFYLPIDRGFGFPERMCVDLPTTLRIRREELEEHRFLRKGRLNQISYQHFRERVAEFFRRFPYDEWYPLDKEEFECYQKDYCAEPFPWQEN